MGQKKNPRRIHAGARDRARAYVLATQTHCAICGREVDKGLPWTHPLAPEADEIIPVSLGGSPIDVSNMQLTHRICNQRKGNGRRGR